MVNNAQNSMTIKPLFEHDEKTTKMWDPDNLHVVEQVAWTIEPSGSPMTALDYSPDGALLAYSNRPGLMTVASSFDGHIHRVLEQQYSTTAYSGCRFHPSDDSLLITACRDGHLVLFDVTNGSVKSMTRHLGSSLLVMNVDPFGNTFAIGCADGSVRMYDLENMQRTKALVKMIARSSTTQSVNINSLVFHPEDTNILVAAGWNDRILFWDLRTGSPERTIAGPHIRGPGLDLHNDTIVTASARDKKQIEFWDFGTSKKINDITIQPDASGRDCLATAIKIAHNGLDFIVGSTGANIGSAYEFSKLQPIGSTAPLTGSVSIVDIAPFGSSFVIGAENGEARCQMIRLKPI